MDSANLHEHDAKFRKRDKAASWLELFVMFTDGNDDYSYVLSGCFWFGLVDYGRLVKIKGKG